MNLLKSQHGGFQTSSLASVVPFECQMSSAIGTRSIVSCRTFVISKNDFKSVNN